MDRQRIPIGSDPFNRADGGMKIDEDAGWNVEGK